MKLSKEVLIPMGQRIKQLRKGANLSREQLADRLGISLEFVKSIELGKSMSIHTLYMICKTLNTSADYILFGAFAGSANPMNDLLKDQSGDVAQGAYDIVRVYLETLKRTSDS